LYNYVNKKKFNMFIFNLISFSLIALRVASTSSIPAPIDIPLDPVDIPLYLLDIPVDPGLDIPLDPGHIDIPLDTLFPITHIGVSG
jgi:hypothetical protein